MPPIPAWARTSGHDEPAICVHRLTRDIASIVGREEGHQGCDILGRARSFQGDSLNPLPHELTGPLVPQQLSP